MSGIKQTAVRLIFLNITESGTQGVQKCLQIYERPTENKAETSCANGTHVKFRALTSKYLYFHHVLDAACT
jgi:hypothetical protein